MSSKKLFRLYLLEEEYTCFGPRISNGASGCTAEIAFVKWLLYWGNKKERIEYAHLIEKYHGDLWIRASPR